MEHGRESAHKRGEVTGRFKALSRQFNIYPCAGLLKGVVGVKVPGLTTKHSGGRLGCIAFHNHQEQPGCLPT
jgi:hypothetical protein